MKCMGTWKGIALEGYVEKDDCGDLEGTIACLYIEDAEEFLKADLIERVGNEYDWSEELTNLVENHIKQSGDGTLLPEVEAFLMCHHRDSMEEQLIADY